MADDNIKYLEEERVKLWTELRSTQERRVSIENALIGDIDAERQGLANMSTKFGRACGRVNSRDKETARMESGVSTRHQRVEEISKSMWLHTGGACMR